MELSGSKSYTVMESFCDCAFSVFHAWCDFCKQHIVLGKVCETCFDFVIFLYDGRIDFTMLGYCWHWHK